MSKDYVLPLSPFSVDGTFLNALYDAYTSTPDLSSKLSGKLGMGCLGDCLDLGPPPDTILFLPPPPPSLPDLLLNSSSCTSPQLCESWLPINRLPEGGDYVELPRKVSSLDDTWLLVLVASSIGVLLLGALLAMFLLKCREMNMFSNNECSVHTRDHRQIKNHHEPRDCTSVTNLNGNNAKLVHPTDTVLYHGTANIHTDNRMVWAALTPRGTQHFISETYPRDLVDYVETEDHYETIDNLHVQPVIPGVHPNYHTYQPTYQKDYDYEEPTPLIESYQLDNMSNREYQYSVLGGNTDMRCSSLGLGGTLRRGLPLGLPLRPQVSSPTRIENPNLPPLNLYPHKGNTLKRNTMCYRNNDANTLSKYGC
ncbi:hypothetical protein QE152_g13110 [Popillia japonica]|uniref:Uncharacterized protein n=1 Tax=Popillia japonica TaxID=7064 RepID=A0AAW1LDN8_POPJA